MQTYRSILFLLVLVAATVGWAKVGQLAEAQEAQQAEEAGPPWPELIYDNNNPWPRQNLDPDAWVAVAYVPELEKAWPIFTGVAEPGASNGLEKSDLLRVRQPTYTYQLEMGVEGVLLVHIKEDGTVMVRARYVLAPWLEVRCDEVER